MARGRKSEPCCATMSKGMGCCKVESLITVDERGQMVLPKEVRDKAGIRSGDKLALVSWGSSNKVSCLSLVKAEDFAEMVKDLLGPMMKEMVKK